MEIVDKVQCFEGWIQAGVVVTHSVVVACLMEHTRGCMM